MMWIRRVTFDCPDLWLDLIDELAQAECLSRAAILQRAIYWELRAHGIEPDKQSEA